MDKSEAKRRVKKLAKRLSGLSREDEEALRILADDDDIHNGRSGRRVPTINASALKKKPPLESEIRLCLDFGTAMSKAWATGRNASTTIPLILSTDQATGNQLSVPSSVFISYSGHIYFGKSAEIHHRQEVEGGRSRFDNLKRVLSDAEVGQELDDVPLPLSVDPVDSGLSKGDLLVLYLAWLTDLALTALQSVAKGAKRPLVGDIESLRYVKRRFAIPCFEDGEDDHQAAERAKWARAIMERSLIRAQLVADTLRGKWNGLTAIDAKIILDEVKAVNLAPLSKLLTATSSIREPIAAGASRFDEQLDEIGGATTRDYRSPTRYLMVIDAGAGTSDFAVFQVFQDPTRARVRYALITPTVRMNRAAGNEVDARLRPLVLKACGIDPISGSPRSKDEFAIISNDLDARIRDYKQLLFTQRRIEISLRPNVKGVLTLDSLLEDQSFRELGEQLIDTRRTIFQSLFPDEFLERVRLTNERFGRPMPLFVLLTGGTSSLPIVQNLASGGLEISGAKFEFIHVRDVPKWVARLPRDAAELVDRAYRQSAVAIGGSVPDLPEETPDFRTPVTPARAGYRKLEKYQVTGVG